MMNIEFPSSKEVSLSTKRKSTTSFTTTTKTTKLKWFQVHLVMTMIMMTTISSSSSSFVKAFTSRFHSFSSSRSYAFITTKIKELVSNKESTCSSSLFLWNDKVQSISKSYDVWNPNRCFVSSSSSSSLLRKHNGRYSSTYLFMDTTDKEDIVTSKTSWNIPELKKEITRLTLRCHKKIGKATTRLSKANEEVEEIRTNPDVTQEQLEACPNIGLLEQELDDLRKRLRSLNDLEQKLQSVKNGKNVELPDDILSLVMDLDVNDAPPTREERPKTKKQKGPRTVAPRLPYFRYYSENNTEIRVGRRSQDNDELSCNPEHRDGNDWWMHASGCPGSHVVIRCHDNNLDKDVVMDAAALAARQSKCNGNVIKVNLTRCRDVKKPPGAKFGLVQLVGNVETVSVNMKQVEKRLERLDATMLMNEDSN